MSEYMSCPSFTDGGMEGRKDVHEDEKLNCLNDSQRLGIDAPPAYGSYTRRRS